MDTSSAEVILEQLVGIIVGPEYKDETIYTERSVDDRGTLIHLFVSQKIIGIVIGKQGKMALSLRTIMNAAGRWENAKISLKIDVAV